MQAAPLTVEGRQADSVQLGRLALRLFDSDVNDPAADGDVASADVSVDDVPVIEGDAPLEMDILVHLLMR